MCILWQYHLKRLDSLGNTFYAGHRTQTITARSLVKTDLFVSECSKFSFYSEKLLYLPRIIYNFIVCEKNFLFF